MSTRTIRISRSFVRRAIHTAPQAPSIAPKKTIDIKAIRQDPELYEQNALGRNYKLQSTYPALIVSQTKDWHVLEGQAQSFRKRNNQLKPLLSNPNAQLDEDSEDARRLNGMSMEQRIAEARSLKENISVFAKQQSAITTEIEHHAALIPNLTSNETPRGDTFTSAGYLNENLKVEHSALKRSHVEIGTLLKILNFKSAATTSGWGWYFLCNGAALLEQALVQYAKDILWNRGWNIDTPPSIVYTHINEACGYQPRDQNDEGQVYSIRQSAHDIGRKPELSLAATAEIPLAGMRANTTLHEAEFPIKTSGISRCFRGEAGARGVDASGLYRVHEFTKVEMFAWTLPSEEASTAVFDEMLSIQMEILQSLNLYCRILEMPSTDLGASASRKRDIEAFFPSRKAIDNGWGEVTSVSTCTDYQTRRLATRVSLKSQGGKLAFPYTVNGTAMAIPRVLAAILETGWDEEKQVVKIPEVLWPYMPRGMEVISLRR